MGWTGDSDWRDDPAMALALLVWQVDMGVTEALEDSPLDRLAQPAGAAGGPVAMPAAGNAAVPAARAPAAPGAAAAMPAIPLSTGADPAQLAAAAGDLPALADAMRGFDGCELKMGARSFVFADGQPAARVMVIGEGPGREEDLRGLPFVGPAGQMLDRMFAAIGLRRDHPDPDAALYITNTVPWRPPGNRTPTDDEIALLRPFLWRHIDLAAPQLLVLMGNAACQAVLQQKGISRLRGQWTQALGRDVLPMYHPSALLHRPELKRDAWADLLTLQARMRELP